MKKSGFTLIEILGVMVVLGVISLITIPVINSSLKNSKQKLYNEQINTIKSGLKNWANSNIFMLPDNSDTITLTLGQIKQSGNLNYEIKNPKNDKCFSNESLLTITKNNNNYIYDIKELKDISCDELENYPVINLNGDVVMYIKVGSPYNELGASATSTTGKQITNSIEKTISGSGSSINTSTIGNYVITYKVNDNGKVMAVIRNVFVIN